MIEISDDEYESLKEDSEALQHLFDTGIATPTQAYVYDEDEEDDA